MRSHTGGKSTERGVLLRRNKNGIYTAPDSAQRQLEALKRAFPDANITVNAPASTDERAK